MNPEQLNNPDSWTRLKQDIDTSGIPDQIAHKLIKESSDLNTARQHFELIRETEELRNRLSPDLANTAVQGVLQESEELPYPTTPPKPKINFEPPDEMRRDKTGEDVSEQGIRAAARARYNK
jgi:hypothetical protein